MIASYKEKLSGAFTKIVKSPFFWIIVLSILLLRTILFTVGTPHHGDLTYPVSLDLYQNAYFPMWNYHTSVSNLESVDRAFAFILIFIARFTGGVDTLSKLFFLVPLLTSGFTATLLVKHVLRQVFPDRRINTLVIIGSAFVYMVNPWVLEQVQAPFFWLAYAVTPGIILLSYRFFSEGRLSYGIGTALLWTVASTTPHYTIFSFLIILFVWFISLLATFFHIDKKPADKLKQDLKRWGIMIVFFLGLNAYWIVTIALSFSQSPISPGYVFTPNMLTMFSANSNWKILSGTDQWTSWWKPELSTRGWGEFVSQNLCIIDIMTYIATAASSIIFIAAVLLARKRKTNLWLFYILCGIWAIGVFCALGGNNPLYRWLATSAPLNSYYGWILRVPGKLSYLLWPTYAVSLGIVGQTAYNYSISKKNRRSRKALVILAISILFIGSIGYTIIKQDDYFNFYYAPVPVPAPYQQAFAYISQNLTNARIADVAPYIQGLGENILGFESSYTWNSRRIAGYFVPRSISVPSIGDYHFTYSSVWQPAYQNFGENSEENLSPDAASWFPFYGVDYVLYHADIAGVNANNASIQDLQILNEKDFELVKRWDNVFLYKVPENVGRIYPLSNSFEYPTLGKLINPYNETNHIFTFNPSQSSTYDWVSENLTSINLEITSTHSIFVSVDIQQTNAVQTFVRIQYSSNSSDPWLEILPQAPPGQDGSFSWKTFGALVQIPNSAKYIRVQLNAGWKSINKSESQVIFRNVRVQEVVPPSISDITSSDVTLYEVKQVGPTLWAVKANATSPFKLVFTEGFDPYWIATVKTDNGTTRVASQRILGSVNSFEINETGHFEISIEYEPQNWFSSGLIISFSSLIIITLTVLYSKRQNIKAVKHRHIRELVNPMSSKK